MDILLFVENGDRSQVYVEGDNSEIVCLTLRKLDFNNLKNATDLVGVETANWLNNYTDQQGLEIVIDAQSRATFDSRNWFTIYEALKEIQMELSEKEGVDDQELYKETLSMS